jgi:hypothetical protein
MIYPSLIPSRSPASGPPHPAHPLAPFGRRDGCGGDITRAALRAARAEHSARRPGRTARAARSRSRAAAACRAAVTAARLLTRNDFAALRVTQGSPSAFHAPPPPPPAAPILSPFAPFQFTLRTPSPSRPCLEAPCTLTPFSLSLKVRSLGGSSAAAAAAAAYRADSDIIAAPERGGGVMRLR